MAKPFKILLDRMSQQAKKTIDQKTQQLLKELPLSVGYSGTEQK